MLEPRRATSVLPAGRWPANAEVGSVTLCWDDRHRRRVLLSQDGERGEFLLDLKQPARLIDGDGLALEDGGVVRVIAASEPLLEIRAKSCGLALLAYHLGNRHLPVQVLDGLLLIRQDHVIEEMVIGLGAACAKVERPFSPEPGAYGCSPGHDHGHDSSHG